ncbi:hypothetical protein [Oleidesulfovibrio alaskensis]|uniref:hypothetical protein n=1 Tax=Oleidesulfovibrio alaskensis TaxID=58180 RepID=UPI000416FE96|nr:hypothetical protein [Oleidesulfovibrio alaskensis]
MSLEEWQANLAEYRKIIILALVTREKAQPPLRVWYLKHSLSKNEHIDFDEALRYAVADGEVIMHKGDVIMRGPNFDLAVSDIADR